MGGWNTTTYYIYPNVTAGHDVLQDPALDLSSTTTVIAFAAAFAAVAVVFVFLRFFAMWNGDRKKDRGKLKMSDWSIGAALVFACTFFGLCIAIIKRIPGSQKQVFALNILMPAPSIQLAAGSAACCATALYLSRVSILLFYQEIFGALRGQRKAIYLALALISAWWVTFLTVSAVYLKKGCTPDRSVYMLAMSTEVLVALDILSVPAISAIPLLILWRLQMSTPRKFWVILAFALSLVCTVSSVFRFVYVHRLTENWSLHDEDPMAFASLVKRTYIWTIVDTGMAVVGACLTPVLGLVHKTTCAIGRRGSNSGLWKSFATAKSESCGTTPIREKFEPNLMRTSDKDDTEADMDTYIIPEEHSFV